jgi:hypothetical protein
MGDASFEARVLAVPVEPISIVSPLRQHEQ